jgi:hypothetical protein
MRLAAFRSVLILGLLGAPFARAESDTTASQVIPFDSMTESNRNVIHGVTDHYTLRREYPAERFHAPITIFEYLIDHMEACSALAQKVGLITYRATRRADGRLYADDHAGAAGYMLNVYAGPGKRVVYVEGTEHGWFDVTGRGVAVVVYRVTQADAIEYTRTAFVKVDNVVLAALTQLFSAFLRSSVDSHFTHVIHNPIVLSQRVKQEPQLLLDQIRLMTEADQELLTPFVALVHSNTTAGAVATVHSH